MIGLCARFYELFKETHWMGVARLWAGGVKAGCGVLQVQEAGAAGDGLG